MPPSDSRVNFVRTVLRALPPVERVTRAARALTQALHEHRPLQLLPEPGESLATWLHLAARNSAEPVPLRGVLGESHGNHRIDRAPQVVTNIQMLSAATSDGIALTHLLCGLIAGADLKPDQFSFHAALDESDSIAEHLSSGHALVIGTGSVSIPAVILNTFVPGCYFGYKQSEPIVASLSDALWLNFGSGKCLLRRDGGGPSARKNIGLLALMKNPWNLDFRLLWAAGLTSAATLAAAHLYHHGWGPLASLAHKATAIVFSQSDPASPIIPLAWLERSEDTEAWKAAPEAFGPAGDFRIGDADDTHPTEDLKTMIDGLPAAQRRAVLSYLWAVAVSERCESDTPEAEIHQTIVDAVRNDEEGSGYDHRHPVPRFKTWQRTLERAATLAAQRHGEPMRRRLIFLGLIRSTSE